MADKSPASFEPVLQRNIFDQEKEVIFDFFGEGIVQKLDGVIDRAPCPCLDILIGLGHIFMGIDKA